MLGSFLAGTNESPGEIIFAHGKTFKNYRGMGSISAMKKGSAERYFQNSSDAAEKLVPEGVEGRVILKGPVSTEIFQMTGGVRSSLGYCGAKNLKEFVDRAEFVRISNSALKESHPHEVSISEEAPNYRR
jgi:IMP dehydrogenase